MAQVTGRNLPPPQSPFVDSPSLNLSYDGYQFLLAQFAAAAANQSTATVDQNLAATGTNQATALQLSSQWNEVDTATVTANGVLLSSYQQGQSQTVVNLSGISINVYPPPGSQIDALLPNQAYALASGLRVAFDFFSPTQIRS